MRLLWTCILALIVIGAWVGLRGGRERASPWAGPEGASSEPLPEGEPPAPAASTLDLPASEPLPAAQVEPSASVAGPPGADGASVPTASATIPAPAATGASVEPLADGSGVTLDGRFVVRGRGSDDDPLRVPWDLLISAQESYDPGKGKLEVPSRVTTLNGRTVSITGYFAAGVLEDETQELLVMLNKWDGCCLGVPPTPYDAVEVKLATPVRLRGKHLLRYGTVTGTLECEPFLIGDWLVGMYRMTDATLEWGG